VGDALTRRITLRAADIPGMVLPPLPFASRTGLGVYSKPPVVADATQRGEFTGQRIETVTYVCEKPGRYTLPALTIPWFDVDDGQLKKFTLPAVTLKVAANPSSRVGASWLDDTPQQPSTRSWWWTGLFTCIILAAGTWCWHFRRLLTTRFHLWRMHRSESEAAYFARVQSACQSGDPAMTYNAILGWLDRFYTSNSPITVARFIRDTADDELRDQVAELERLVFAPAAARHNTWSGEAMYTSIVRARKRRYWGQWQCDRQSGISLPPLHPS
jgi:hypothetical protein